MISSIQIEGYRGFDHFEMNNLGRINLLVGPNNSGKSSALEAIGLLSSAGSPALLWQMLRRRGEGLLEEEPSGFSSWIELDVSHLFNGHEPRPGSLIRFAADGGPMRTLEYRFAELSLEEYEGPKPFFDALEIRNSRLALKTDGHPKPNMSPVYPLTASGSIFFEVPPPVLTDSKAPPVCFVATDLPSSDELVVMWNKLARADRGAVLKALRFLDSAVDEIETQSTSRYGSRVRAGFAIKRKGWQFPVPIGSMGEGMSRTLSMAIVMEQCQGGVLLVDDIDTGLHYSTMAQMWGSIYSAAKKFDFQVFATTHSYDCVYSLAQICSSSDMQQAVTVQRIEPGKHRSIPYDESEISVAALRDIEVR